MLHAETFQCFLGAHGFPILLLGVLAAKKFLLLVGLESLHAHVLVVALDEMHIVFFILQVHKVVDDTLSIGATVDVVAQKIKLVVLRDLEGVFEQ